MLNINVGDTVEFSVRNKGKKHRAFSKLSGDTSPRHIEGKLGYGFLLTSFLSRLYSMLPDSICLKQEANFIKPYYVGDKIDIKGTITNKSESTRLIEVETEMYCKENLIFKGKGIVKLI